MFNSFFNFVWLKVPDKVKGWVFSHLLRKPCNFFDCLSHSWFAEVTKACLVCCNNRFFVKILCNCNNIWSLRCNFFLYAWKILFYLELHNHLTLTRNPWRLNLTNVNSHFEYKIIVLYTFIADNYFIFNPASVCFICPKPWWRHDFSEFTFLQVWLIFCNNVQFWACFQVFWGMPHFYFFRINDFLSYFIH